jgi:hypothetical protein
VARFVLPLTTGAGPVLLPLAGVAWLARVSPVVARFVLPLTTGAGPVLLPLAGVAPSFRAGSPGAIARPLRGGFMPLRLAQSFVRIHSIVCAL